MRRKRIPKYRHHKASGLAVITVNGRDHYLGPYGTPESRDAYAKIVDEWNTMGQASTYGILTDASVSMLINDYLNFCEGYYPKSKNSETVHAKLALRFMAPYLDERAKDFGPLKLKTVRENMVGSKVKRTGRPYSRQYINCLVDRICRMFRWAAENEVVPITVYQALSNVPGLKRGRTLAPEAPKVRPVDDAVVEQTKKHCSAVVRDMITLQQLTGMRPGEVCTLTVGMIDRSHPEVWVAILPEHKCAWRGKTREIFLGPQAQALLLPYLQRDVDVALFSAKESEQQRNAKRTEARVTPLNLGNRRGYSTHVRRGTMRRRPPNEFYTSGTYARSVRYACMRAYPIPKGSSDAESAAWRAAWWWAPNRLRHSAATKVRKSFGLEAAQVMLGHSTADVTQVYAEANREMGITIAAKFG